jgi:hypothetical protein
MTQPQPYVPFEVLAIQMLASVQQQLTEFEASVSQQFTDLSGKVDQIMTEEQDIEAAETQISDEIAALNNAEQALATYIQGLQAGSVTPQDITTLQGLASDLSTAVGNVQGLVPPPAPSSGPAEHTESGSGSDSLHTG